MRDGRGVSVRLVVVVAVLATAVAWIGLRLWFDAGHALPGASWGGAVLIVFMAVGVYCAGLPIRRFLRGQATRPLSPLRAMRTLVLAQAAALTGALVAGWYAAQALVLLPNADVDSVRAAMLRSLAVCVSGVLMVVAGLLVQAMCRIDDRGRDRDREQDLEPDRDLDRGLERDRDAGPRSDRDERRRSDRDRRQGRRSDRDQGSQETGGDRR